MYTYAFLTHSTALELPEGIVGALELVPSETVAAVVEPDLTSEMLQSDEQLVQAVLWHDRVLHHLFEQTTVLPLRFGTFFVSRQSLLDYLQSHALEYQAKLAHLHNKAEQVVKLSPLPPSPAPRSDLQGRAYFLAKKQQYQHQLDWQQDQQAELSQLLATIAQSYPQYQRSQPTDTIERLYLLVDRSQTAEVQQQAQGWQRLVSRWELVLGEPSPPYHFV